MDYLTAGDRYRALYGNVETVPKTLEIVAQGMQHILVELAKPSLQD